MEKSQLNELLYQALETEKGGVQVYRTAIQCRVNACPWVPSSRPAR
jgi:hypothetical protein